MAIPRDTVMILVLCTLSDNAQELCHIIPKSTKGCKRYGYTSYSSDRNI